MRCLARNRRKIYYALCTGYSENDDHEEQPVYGAPQELQIRVGRGTGGVYNDAFGKRITRERKLVTTQTDLPIDENTVFWIDTDDTSKPHDHVMAAPPSVGLTEVVYHLKRVDISHA